MTQTKVLIVDDNTGYREAFGRNLAVKGYQVFEAEDGARAIERVRGDSPDVVVTDLAMRHPTEGLDLIRQIRSLRPHLPVIMISAVGTFDEGAEATRLGAYRVISKSRIDEEIARLYEAIDAASVQHAQCRQLIEEITDLASRAAEDRTGSINALNGVLRREDVPDSIKGEAFDLLDVLADEAESAGGDAAVIPEEGRAPSEEALLTVQNELREALVGFDSFQDETRKSLTTAEFLFQQGRESQAGFDFSRSMGFAYCFAVESEVKTRLRKKMQKFFGDRATPELIQSLLEDNRKSISIFFQQYLLRLQRGSENEATLENFFFTFLRINEHRGKYRPDGLKALGIVLICFARTYEFEKFKRTIKIDNPLALNGLKDDDEVLEFASLLINLQHYRNPYIHPEISQMTKISKIRDTAFSCLNLVAAIQ